MIEENNSTWLSHEAWAGVSWRWTWLFSCRARNSATTATCGRRGCRRCVRPETRPAVPALQFTQYQRGNPHTANHIAATNAVKH